MELRASVEVLESMDKFLNWTFAILSKRMTGSLPELSSNVESSSRALCIEIRITKFSKWLLEIVRLVQDTPTGNSQAVDVEMRLEFVMVRLSIRIPLKSPPPASVPVTFSNVTSLNPGVKNSPVK